MTEQEVADLARLRAVTAAIMILGAEGIPPDAIAMLLVGDARRNIRPGALDRALVTALQSLLDVTDAHRDKITWTKS